MNPFAVTSQAEAMKYVNVCRQHRASNFEPEELPEIMSYLHDRGVKGFVAMNVLVFDDELPLVEERVRQMAEAGVDAVIVQVGGISDCFRGHTGICTSDEYIPYDISKHGVQPEVDGQGLDVLWTFGK